MVRDDVPDGDRAGLRVSRRTFLRYSGAAAASGFMLAHDPASAFAAAQDPQPQKIFETWLRRRADQLSLKLEFWNLELVTGSGPAHLERVHNDRSSYLVVQFHPQALAEEAFYKSGGALENDAEDASGPAQAGDVPAAPPIAARLAGPTRLAFLVPSNALPMAFTVDRLLSWLDLSPRVVTNATPRGILPDKLKSPRKPTTTQTAIELPWHLVLSPHAGTTWTHAAGPVTADGRTELWHTRFAVRALDGQGQPVADEGDDQARTVRAVWATDDGPDFETYVDDDTPPDELSDDVPFRTSLTRRDRLDIVRLSSDFSLAKQSRVAPLREGADGKRFVPDVVEVDRLMLSSLGGFLDSSFDNELAFLAGRYNTSLLQWRHLAALGRDSYVRVVRKGFLFPFGFKAALVRVTERRFDHIGNSTAKPRGAYLRQRVFIVVLKATRRFAGDPALLHDGRQIPFRSMSCVTKATPDLDDPQAYTTFPDKEVFVPSLPSGAPFAFDLRGTDWAGDTVAFSAPAVWVDDTRAYDPANLQTILDAYAAAPAEQAGMAFPAPFEGRKVAFAPAKLSGDTTFVVRDVAFGAGFAAPALTPDDLAGAGNPGFYPTLAAATIELSESGAAAGSGPTPSARFGYFDLYVEHGFGNGANNHLNRGDVLFTRAGDDPAAVFALDAKSAGGAATPALALEGYSRELGPTGSPEDAKTGGFDPAQVLSDGAKILGGIALNTVLAAVGDFFSDKEKALTIVSRHEQGPNRVVTEIDFHPDLQAGPPGLTLFAPDPSLGVPSKADIHAEVVTDLDTPDASTHFVEGKLTGFVVLLFGGQTTGAAGATTFIRVPVQSLEFRAGSSTKDELHIQLGDISFHGVLAFVEELSELLSFGDSGGLKIDVDGTGIRIELKVALPDITVGVMSLTNMAIFVALVIPFDGSPVELMFAFCSRENPFTLTVWIFGGGGFVGLTVSVRGVELFELSFEFGGGYAFSLAGLASGKVEAKAGIYFRVETLPDDTQQCTLESYIRIGGAVSVLGLITVSLEFYVALSYMEPPGSLVGEARLTVEIDLTVFSTSVELTVRKEITNSDGGGGQGLSAQAMAAPLSMQQSEPVALQSSSVGPAVSWADLMTADQWQQDYVTAYAPLGA